MIFELRAKRSAKSSNNLALNSFCLAPRNALLDKNLKVRSTVSSDTLQKRTQSLTGRLPEPSAVKAQSTACRVLERDHMGRFERHTSELS